MEDPLPCTAIISKGHRKGSECGRPYVAISDEPFCKLHASKLANQETCEIILVKGKRKNRSCNRKAITVTKDGTHLCKLHHEMELKRPYNPYTEHEYAITQVDEGSLVYSKGSLQLDGLHPKLAVSM